MKQLSVSPWPLTVLLALGLAGCGSDEESGPAKGSTGGSGPASARAGGATGTGGSPVASTGGATGSAGSSGAGGAVAAGGSSGAAGGGGSGGRAAGGAAGGNPVGQGGSGGAGRTDAGRADGQTDGGGAGADTWDSFGLPFMVKYCVSCHNDDGAGTAARNYRMLAVVMREKVDIACGTAKSQADRVARNCPTGAPRANQFPAGGGPKPSNDERDRLLRWIDANLP